MKRWISILLAAVMLMGLLFTATGCATEDLEELAEILEELEEYQEEDIPDEDAEESEQSADSEDSYDDDIEISVVTPEDDSDSTSSSETLDYDGWYTTKDDVALYIYTYGCLPENFITKKEAKKLGWTGGALDPYADDCSIGGDRFGNYEGLLPQAPGRTYTECDIDTMDARSRGAKRIVFSNDGLVYYTDDHYETFELLYGEP